MFEALSERLRSAPEQIAANIKLEGDSVFDANNGLAAMCAVMTEQAEDAIHQFRTEHTERFENIEDGDARADAWDRVASRD